MAMALATLLLFAPGVDAAITLEVRVDAKIETDVAVHVRVHNIGDEPAEGVLPDATLLGASASGAERAAVPSGFEMTWDVHLPRPTELGTFPLVVIVHYLDGLGHRMSAPAIHLVRNAGTPPARVTLALEASPLVTIAAGSVRIVNQEDDPIAGTLVLITGEELRVVPAERPIEVPAGGTIRVPVELRNLSALAGSTTSLWASLSLRHASYADTVVASVAVPVVVASSDAPRAIAWPLGAIVVGGAIVWAIRRWVAPASTPRSRSERRRAPR